MGILGREQQELDWDDPGGILPARDIPVGSIPGGFLGSGKDLGMGREEGAWRDGNVTNEIPWIGNRIHLVVDQAGGKWWFPSQFSPKTGKSGIPTQPQLGRGSCCFPVGSQGFGQGTPGIRFNPGENPLGKGESRGR